MSLVESVLVHRHLIELCIEDSNLPSLRYIQDLECLEILKLRKCLEMQYEQCETLNLPHLKRLEVTKETPFGSLACLQDCKKLEHLVITDCDELSKQKCFFALFLLIHCRRYPKAPRFFFSKISRSFHFYI